MQLVALFKSLLWNLLNIYLLNTLVECLAKLPYKFMKFMNRPFKRVFRSSFLQIIKLSNFPPNF